MDYAEFITGIRFRFLQPHVPIPIPEDHYRARLESILETGSIGGLERLGLWLELINTVIPGDGSDMKSVIGRLCRMPRMSSLAIGVMIARGVGSMPEDDVFVNIGVWQGFTLLCGMVANPERTCIGVDNFSEFGGPRDRFLERFLAHQTDRHHFYDMDYEEYFSRIHCGSIGFYIYDGSHGYADQLKGLQVAEPFFSDDCIIMVDDTNWEEPRQATLDFIARSRFPYEILLDVRTRNNCHPTFWNGIMIIQKQAGESRQPPRV